MPKIVTRGTKLYVIGMKHFLHLNPAAPARVDFQICSEKILILPRLTEGAVKGKEDSRGLIMMIETHSALAKVQLEGHCQLSKRRISRRLIKFDPSSLSNFCDNMS